MGIMIELFSKFGNSLLWMTYKIAFLFFLMACPYILNLEHTYGIYGIDYFEIPLLLIPPNL